MATDRYARQTFKNLLNGVGGMIGQTTTTLISQTTSINLNQNGADENTNLQLHNNKMINLKSVNVLNTHHHTTTNSANLQSTNITGFTSSNNTNNTNCSQRNALGDIGNRILPNSNSQLAGIGKKELLIKQSSTLPDLVSKGGDVFNKANNLGSTNTNVNANCAQISNGVSSKPAFQLNVQEDADESNISMEEDVIDIDQFDSDNTQLCTEYVKEIYLYLNELEKRYRISSNFLDKKIVSAKMRSVLIDWLIQVHLKFHLLQETLYLCVYIIDSFLEAEDVPKMQLQLVGVTAMFLASKYEEMYVPAIEDFVYMTDNTYTKAEIRQMEIRILKRLDFMFCKPTPLHFLRRFSKAGQSDPKQHTLAKFFMELSLHDSEFSSMDPSYLAASSLCLAFKLIGDTKWDRTLEYYSIYKEKSLQAGMQKIAKLTIRSLEPDYKYKGVINKYGASKFLRISIMPELTSDYMKELASSA